MDTFIAKVSVLQIIWEHDHQKCYPQRDSYEAWIQGLRLCPINKIQVTIR